MCPLTAFEASDAKNTAGPPSSSGFNQRPAGVLEQMKLSNGCLLPSACGSLNGAVWGVAIYPGPKPLH